jgi:flagellar biosynthesis protein FliP
VTVLWGGSLLMVLGLIVFLGKVMGDRLGGYRRGSGRGPELTVLQRTGLGPKQGVATVRFGDRVVLVGLGEGGVRFLCEETQPIIADDAAEVPVTDAPVLSLSETPRLPSADEPSRPARPARWSGPRIFRAPRGLHLLAVAFMLPLALANGLSAQGGLVVPKGLEGMERPKMDLEGGEELLQRLQGMAGLQQSGEPASRADSVSILSQAAGGFGGRPGQPQSTVPGVAQILEALPQVSMQLGEGPRGEALRLTGPVGTVLFVGFLTVIPTLLLLMTSFTRILIVLHLLKQAIGAQTVPPAHLLAAMAMLLTGFVMAPTLNEVNRTALAPWMEGEIETGEMFHEASFPFRRFMLANTRQEDLNTFIALRQAPPPMTQNEIPMIVLMSAFVTSELRAAFQIGFALFLPFLVIDLVVASVLMSMGMFMLPPVLVSLPFKLLLFVMVDGWPLVLGGVVRSFVT